MEKTYSYASDFGSSIDESQLHSEVEVSLPNITHINRMDNDVHIIFSSSLTTEEQATLDTIVSNHVPSTAVDLTKAKFVQSLISKKDYIKTTSYIKIFSFAYSGSTYVTPIIAIKCIAYMESNATSYSIRIYNKTNHTIIAEKTGLTNTDAEIIDLGTISNIPTEKALIELQAKHDDSQKNKKIYVEEMTYFS